MLDRIQSICRSLPEDRRTPYPDWSEDDLLAPAEMPGGLDLTDRFVAALEDAHGIPLRSVDDLANLLRGNGAAEGYVDPDLLPLLAGLVGFRLHSDWDPSDPDRYAFGITRATLAIAESGTIVLTDTDTSARLGALAPWTHVAVLDPATIVPSIPDALARLGNDPNIIWVTGPSKTADVEGILIEGVHGPATQAVLIEKMNSSISPARGGG